MRNTFCSIFAAISLSIVAICGFHSTAEAKNLKCDLGAGYRQDYFSWELAGPNDTPPVLSRLTWEDLQIFEITAECKKITCNNVYMKFFADYGWIYHGKSHDSDFMQEKQSGKIVEVLSSTANAGKGDVWDISGGVGYFLHTNFCALKVAPIAGFSYHEQFLKMFDGVSRINLLFPESQGALFSDLNSNYKARWYGPWVGFDLYYHINDQLTVTTTFEYHGMRYSATGHWNLRSDFAGDFHHRGWGHGLFGSASLDYNFCNKWYLGGQFRCNYAKVNNGNDSTPVFEKSNNEIFVTHMKGKIKSVKWHSFSILATLGYNF